MLPVPFVNVGVSVLLCPIPIAEGAAVKEVIAGAATTVIVVFSVQVAGVVAALLTVSVKMVVAASAPVLIGAPVAALIVFAF